MIVRAPRQESEAAAQERIRQRLGVDHDLPLVVAEGGGRGLVQRDRLGGDHVHQGTALVAREDRTVDRLRILLAEQDHAAPRAAQRLVGGGGDEVGVRHGRGMKACGHQAGEVRHVGEHGGPDLVGDGTEGREVEGARVGRVTHHDHLRPRAARQLPDLLEVEAAVGLAHAVGHDAEVLAGEIDGAPVGQVSPVGEVHAENRVAHLELREVDAHVRL